MTLHTSINGREHSVDFKYITGIATSNSRVKISLDKDLPIHKTWAPYVHSNVLRLPEGSIVVIKTLNR